MSIPDGPTLLGIAAIITSLTGLITAVRRSPRESGAADEGRRANR